MPVVQWPPPEAEAHEREQVEVLQKHIPTKKMERQWPPPPPQYQGESGRVLDKKILKIPKKNFFLRSLILLKYYNSRKF